MATTNRETIAGDEFDVDGVSIVGMTAPQLRVLVRRLQEEIMKEKQERNLMQLERDKLHTFHEICRQQLVDCQAGLRLMEHENENAEEKHQIALKHVGQKVKFLMYEHELHLNDVVEERMAALKTADDDFLQETLKQIEDKNNRTQKLVDENLLHLKQIQNLKLLCARQLSEARTVFLAEKENLQTKAEKRLMDTRERLDVKYRMELVELETRKNKHIDDLVSQHNSAFSNMKYYFNDIMDNNLSIIKSLKEQLKDVQYKLDFATMREKERARRVSRESAVQRQRRQSTPHSGTTVVRTTGSGPRNGPTFNSRAALETKSQLSKCKTAYDNLLCENEVLELRFKKLQEERDGLEKNYKAVIQEMVQEAQFHAVMLDGRISRLKNLLQEERAQVARVVAGADVGPDLKAVMRDHLEEFITRCSTRVQELLYELARVCKAHDDLLRTYEAKLHQYGIPPEELGFKPLRVDMMNLRLGRGPAGLVTLNK